MINHYVPVNVQVWLSGRQISVTLSIEGICKCTQGKHSLIIMGSDVCVKGE